MTLSGVERQILTELVAGARRFNAFVVPMASGWKDGDGRALPGEEDLRGQLTVEMNRMQEHLDRARVGLGISEE